MVVLVNRVIVMCLTDKGVIVIGSTVLIVRVILMSCVAKGSYCD